MPWNVTADSLHLVEVVGHPPSARIGLSVLSYLSGCAYLELFMKDLRLYLTRTKVKSMLANNSICDYYGRLILVGLLYAVTGLNIRIRWLQNSTLLAQSVRNTQNDRSKLVIDPSVTAVSAVIIRW
ncbi:hypothetical protein K0H71_20100 [Bacillus sp. IITD106]|nr:hypothetical protein [Bacillus sp. IITD106]